jgi:hypothetical protein
MNSGIALLAGASVVALAAAADLNKKPMPMKASPALPVAKDTWTWWIEGGAVNANNNSLNLGVGGIKPGWGPEGAIGFDWQPFAPMPCRWPIQVWLDAQECAVRCCLLGRNS